MKIFTFRSILWLIFTLLLIAGNDSLAQRKWYKGATHTHTTATDGTQSPGWISIVYKANGYNFAFFTDHNYITDASMYNTSNFICIPGEEVTLHRHVTALDIKRVIIPLTADLQKVLDTIKSQGAIAILNHPFWNPTPSFMGYGFLQHKPISAAEIMQWQNLDFIEIHNALNEIKYGNHDDQKLWDTILTSGRKMYGVASDDAHRIDEFNKAWIMVNSEALHKDSILKAMREGMFYSSNGVSIKQIGIKDSMIRIDTENASTIEFIGANGTVLKTATGKSGTYKIDGTEKYVRAVATATDGKKAWTQPLVWNYSFSNNLSISEDSSNVVDPRSFRSTAALIYPNPVSTGILYLKATQFAGQKIPYTITNGSGQVVRKAKLNFVTEKASINVSSLTPGNYKLSIQFADKVETHVIVIR